jgi:protein-S-isoprenylcysteine O-methyltransferase Ste14
MPNHSKVTPFFLLQCGIVLLVLGYLIVKQSRWDALRCVALILAIPSAVLLMIARYQLGQSFSVTAQARELVIDGIYSKIRNPIYVFGGLFICSVLLLLGKPLYLAVFAVLIPLQIVRARKEAKVLEEKFGDAYRTYRARTWF